VLKNVGAIIVLALMVNGISSELAYCTGAYSISNPDAPGWNSPSFNYWGRCIDLRYEPERRLGYCRSILGSGHYDDNELLVKIGNAYADEGETAKALDAYNESLTKARGRDDSVDIQLALQGRAELYAVTGRYPEALADATEVLDITKASVAGYNTRCWIEALIGKQLDAARSDCDQALKLEPDSADAFDSRAFVEFRSGDLDAAAADYGKALAQRPKSPSSLFMQGVIKAKRGDQDGGKADIARAQDFDSSIVRRYASYGVVVAQPASSGK
jgi:tetratricopeptide (TPR) repeat protein